MNYPILVFVMTFAVLVLAVRTGDVLRRRAGLPKENAQAEAGVLLSATLTLLFFIIGFSFSMAISRYDLRKNCELTEAIAIDTALSGAALMPASDAAKTQSLLRKYLDQRLLFYETRSEGERAAIRAETVSLQSELRSTIRSSIAAVPPPLMGLLVSAGNDIVNSERRSQAAWLNRIPEAAWALMVTIAVGNCWIIGYRSRRTDWLAFLIVPFAASVCFFLIADLDSAAGGVIRVHAENLNAVLRSLSELR